MKRKPVWACLAALVAAGALAAPQLGVAAAGKSHKVDMKCTTPFTKGSTSKFAGSCTGTPFGKIKAAGTLIIPHTTFTITVKGGTATLKYDGAVNSAGKVKGNWKWTKGTGKLKGIKGSGVAKGDLLGNYVYTGTATY